MPIYEASSTPMYQLASPPGIAQQIEIRTTNVRRARPDVRKISGLGGPRLRSAQERGEAPGRTAMTSGRAASQADQGAAGTGLPAASLR